MKNSDTSWGGEADWYDQLLSEDDTYQSKVILPNLLRMMEIKKGDKVLDLACGQGFFSRFFSKEGASVVGVDISKELIDKAKKVHDGPLHVVDYRVSPSDELSFIESNSLDKVVIVLAIQNIEKIKETFEECNRVLKPSGKLFLVLNHPTFRIPKNSSWGYDEENNVQYRRIDAYLSEIKIPILMHPGISKVSKTISFHRSLQLYFKIFYKTGFVVRRLEEWDSHKKSQKGKRSDAEDVSRKEIPLFMCIECLKSDLQ